MPFHFDKIDMPETITSQLPSMVCRFCGINHVAIRSAHEHACLTCYIAWLEVLVEQQRKTIDALR